MHSRLSTYLHPLAGRPLVWHTASSLAAVHPPAARLFLVGGAEVIPEVVSELVPRLEVLAEDRAAAAPPLGDGPVLVVDAAAPTLGPVLASLLHEEAGTCLVGPDGSVAAARLAARDAAELLASGGDLGGLAAGLRRLPAVPEALVVRDRRSLAQASTLIRDRIVDRLMAGGVSFLLPESVLIDAEVRIGRDTVVYPGVVIEGQTSIGEETVIGPGCRIIDSWVGSGVELKGWNFISRSSIRNRAILEPYVRRGFD